MTRETPAPADSPPASAADEALPASIGRYRILRRLGAGAMGVVYEAQHAERGDRVALKTLHKLDPGALFRLKNEFRRLADLRHPNLASLYELASDAGRWFLTMEFIDGVDFVTYVRQDPATSADRVRRTLTQLAGVLRSIHAAGTLHRDIKSSNVMVTRDGRLVLVDFGLAGDGTLGELETTDSDMFLGTPAYMSPEQAAGHPPTAASEWYAVGVMLYEALSGELPFVGPPLRVLAHKQRVDARPLREVAPLVPADLAALCEGLLRRDPASRLNGDAVTEGAPSPTPTLDPRRRLFVGRADLIAALDDAFDASRRGAPLTVYVHGPSGIGKSALVDHVLERLAERASPLVLVGRCYERESVPYKAFDSLIDGLSDHLRLLPTAEAAALMPREIHALARVFPVLERVPVIADAPRRPLEAPDQQELRRRAFRGLRELLARIADRRPLVLVLGDMQWGDEDSARLLAEILAGPEAPGLLVIGVYRSDEAATSPMLVELKRLHARMENRSEVRNLAVGPLGLEEAQTLARLHLGSAVDRADEEAAAIARESDGSPLFVEELARQALAADRPRGASPSTSLDGVVRGRLRGLPPATRRLVELVALAGRPLQRRLAFHAAALGAEASAVIAELHGLHLLRSHGPGDDAVIECYHDRIRDLIAASVAVDERRHHHRQLALAFVDDGCSDHEVIARHFFAAGEREPAANHAETAAEHAAAALAFNRAADLYQLARAWFPRTGPRGHDLMVRHADALVHAGRGAEAAPLYLQAAEGVTSSAAIELRRRAAEELLVSGRIDEGVRLLRPLMASVGLTYPATPGRANLAIVARLAQLGLRGTRFEPQPESALDPRALLRVDVCWTACKGLCFVDPVRGFASALRALLLALQLGEPRRVIRGLASVGVLMIGRGPASASRRGAALIREAEALARADGDTYLLGLVHTIDGIAGIATGTWEDGLRRLDCGMDLLHDNCAGIAWESSTAQMGTMHALIGLGRLRELSVRAQAWRRESADAGDLHSEVWASLFAAYARLAAGAPREARDEARAAISRWSSAGMHFQHLLALLVEVYADLHEDRPLAAWNRVARRWQEVEDSHILQWTTFRVMATHMRTSAAIAAANSHPEQASVLLRVAAESVAELERNSGERPDARGAALVLRAGIAATHGDRRRALTNLDGALRAYEEAAMAIEARCVRRRLAECAGDHAAIAAIDDELRRRAVGDPRRWTRIAAPGFADDE